MIGILKSKIARDNYATERLFEFGVRWSRFLESLDEELSDLDILIVPQYELSESELRNVHRFLDENGSVLSLHPNRSLLGLLGSEGEDVGSDLGIASDNVLIYSKEVVVLGPTMKIDCPHSLLDFQRTGFSAIGYRSFDGGNLYLYSFSLSETVFAMHYFLFDRKEGVSKKWGEYPLNLLEKEKADLNVPHADLHMMFLRELILRELLRKGTLLPIVWHLPYARLCGALITMDEDWADESVVRNSLSILEEKALPATLFVTSKKGPEEASSYQRLCGLAVHPFYIDAKFDDNVLSKSLMFLPEPPKGARNHRRMIHRPNVFEGQVKHGLQWDSNYGISEGLGYGNGTGIPFFLWHENTRFDLLEFPIHFEDDLYLFEESGFELSETSVGSMVENASSQFFSCLTFVFHPIHLFLNSSSIQDYEGFKLMGISDDSEKLETFRQDIPEREGVRNMFDSLLDYLNSRSDDILVSTCQEVNDHFRRLAKVTLDVDELITVGGCFEGLTLMLPFRKDLEIDRLSSLFTRFTDVRVGAIDCLLAEVDTNKLKNGSIEIPREWLGIYDVQEK